MNDTYLSFYLKVSRIHVFVDALRGIGSPSRICFLLGKDGKMLMMVPYTQKDFRSHRVPKGVYDGQDGLEICSSKLCRILAGINNWDLLCSYRVPGQIYLDGNAVVFDLEKAILIM